MALSKKGSNPQANQKTVEITLLIVLAVIIILSLFLVILAFIR